MNRSADFRSKKAEAESRKKRNGLAIVELQL
jgi:hypothetical protein